MRELEIYPTLEKERPILKCLPTLEDSLTKPYSTSPQICNHSAQILSLLCLKPDGSEAELMTVGGSRV
jgi:hypothetical protein